MTTYSLNRYSSIHIEVPAGTTIEDVSVSQDSQYVKPYLLAVGSPYTKTLDDTTLTITPDSKWMEGITTEVTYGGTSPNKYVVPNNRYFYSPEQRLYSMGTLTNSDNLSKLLSIGLITQTEKSLLEAMGPKLNSLMLSMSKCLVTIFTYDNTALIKDCTLIKAFRRMQQVMYMFGLDSLVEALLFSPGPEREWFRRAYIVRPRSDEFVFENYSLIEKQVNTLANTMKLHNLNTDYIHSVELQVSPNIAWNPVLKGIVTLFCAIRYTHDNIKFSY